MNTTERMKSKLLAAGAVLLATMMTMLLTTNAMHGQGPGDGLGAPMHGPGMGHHEGGPDAQLLPPGMWWRDAKTVSAIGLSTDQQKHIDQIFLDSRIQLIRKHASIEEGQLQIEEALNATPFDQAKAMSWIVRTAEARASLEVANAKMLLSIRGVLTAEQWTKLQALRPKGPRPGDGPGDHRRGPSMRSGHGQKGGQQNTPPAPPTDGGQTPPPSAE